MTIIIKKRLLLYRGYKLKCSIGKSGTIKSKREGDLATPRGTFELGPLYYRKDRIKKLKCRLQKIVIKKNMGWCNDSRSKKYNQEITFPFKYGAEKLYRNDKKYDMFLNIKSNQFPIKKNNGSAIFLHLTNKKYKPTKGCIAILKKNFFKILPLISKKTKITIS
jgi:L,D-peptidoglycan transpeptidase YkuD (ErfK/YbiS/YcfS/YnhG family)